MSGIEDVRDVENRVRLRERYNKVQIDSIRSDRTGSTSE
jgi:hypothetical protein